MEDEKKNKPVLKVPVTVIKATEQTALVEWVAKGLVQRGYVPVSELNGNKVTADALAMATPYGVAWEKFITVEVTPLQISQALHSVGIWTAKDLYSHQQAALGAIQTAYKVTLALLNRAAKNHKEGDL